MNDTSKDKLNCWFISGNTGFQNCMISSSRQKQRWRQTGRHRKEGTTTDEHQQSNISPAICRFLNIIYLEKLTCENWYSKQNLPLSTFPAPEQADLLLMSLTVLTKKEMPIWSKALSLHAIGFKGSKARGVHLKDIKGIQLWSVTMPCLSGCIWLTQSNWSTHRFWKSVFTSPGETTSLYKLVSKNRVCRDR